MLGKVGRFTETSLAVLAFERLFAVMGSLVDGESASDSKRLAAAGEVAGERFYAENK